MTDDEPTTLDILAAANRLCPFCRQRVSSFLGTHANHPHHSNADTLRLINDFHRQCCTGPLK
jgi:hypothetical protein